MATGKVTKRTVDALLAGAATDFLWDDELRGFGLRVTPAGAKSYVFQYRMGGREAAKKRVTIGRHGSPWTPATAREEAARLARMVGQGVDPSEHDRERRRQAVDLAFSGYVDTFVDGYLRTAWKDWRAGERLLKAEAVPVLKAKVLPAIKKADLSAVLDRVRDRPAVARLLHATLRKLFRWAEGRGDVERSPVEGLPAPAAVAARDRVLADPELALAWQSSEALGYPFGPMFRLLIVTGQRREEVAGLEWSELARDARTWSLPAGRAKNGVSHLVPLSSAAVDVLDGLAEALAGNPLDRAATWPTRGLVFSTTGKTAASGHSKAKARLDRTMDKLETERAAAEDREPVAVKPWRVHDFRRTAATGLQRLGVRFEVTEAVLNHVSGAKSGVAGVYQRHDWAAEKRAALEAWGQHVEGLMTAAGRTNVVPISA